MINRGKTVACHTIDVFLFFFKSKFRTRSQRNKQASVHVTRPVMKPPVDRETASLLGKLCLRTNNWKTSF